MKTQREGKSIVAASAAAVTIMRSEAFLLAQCSRTGFTLALEFPLSAKLWAFIIHSTRNMVVFPMDLLHTHSHIHKQRKIFLARAERNREKESEKPSHKQMLIDFFFLLLRLCVDLH